MGPNGELQHYLSDVATMQLIRWSEGGFGMCAHNYDGGMCLIWGAKMCLFAWCLCVRVMYMYAMRRCVCVCVVPLECYLGIFGCSLMYVLQMC